MSYREMAANGQAEMERGPESVWPRALAWAKRELPDEHGPFAAMAALMLKLSGGKVTKAAVRKRLQTQGRDKKAVAERQRRYAPAEEKP